MITDHMLIFKRNTADGGFDDDEDVMKMMMMKMIR